MEAIAQPRRRGEGRGWTNKEVQQLALLRAQRIRAKRIAELLGRSYSSVKGAVWRYCEARPYRRRSA